MAQKNIKVLFETCALLTKQVEEQAKQGKEPDKELLNSITTAFNDILEFEKFFLIQAQDRFYGNVLMSIDFGIDYNQRGVTDLKLDRNPVLLSVNPLFCAEYTFQEFTGAVISEILKMVYLHPSEYGKYNPDSDNGVHEKLNKASDAATNSIVKRDIRLIGNDSRSSSNTGCRLPQDAYTPTAMNRECGVNSMGEMPMDYYYKILSKFKDKNQQGPNGMPIDISGSGSGGNMQCNPSGIATKNNNSGQPTHQWEKSDPDETEEQLKSIVSTAYNNLSEKDRGYMAGCVQSKIKEILAPPEISWKDVLRKMVGSVPVPHRNTRRRLNRRQPERADISGRLPKRVVNVICAFDTSGSMSDDDLMYCMNEVFNIVKVYEGYEITVVECDMKIQKIYKARKMSDLQLNMAGRGGTSFIPVIDYINGNDKYKNNPKYPNAGKYKDALLVYFTDGYGDYEIEKPKTYRNLWVVLDREENLSLKNPYGDVKALKKDKDYRKMKGYR